MDTSPTNEPILNSKGMVCPRCLERNNVLKFTPLQLPDHYRDIVTPIYKCPNCRFLFAPSLNN